MIVSLMLTDVGARKTHASQEVKYCSTRCRNNKPGPVDRKIEAAFAAILDGRSFEGSDGKEVEAAVIANDGNSKEKGKKKKVKGDSRRIIECGEVETAFFGHQTDPEKVFGRRKNRAARGVRERPEDWKSVDMVSDEEKETEPKRSTENEPEPDFTASDGSTVEEDHMAGGVLLNSAEGYGGGKIRPSQEKSDVNGSVGGEKGWAELQVRLSSLLTVRVHGTTSSKGSQRLRNFSSNHRRPGYTTAAHAELTGIPRSIPSPTSFPKGPVKYVCHIPSTAPTQPTRKAARAAQPTGSRLRLFHADQS
jgi:hypothetical protein